MTRSYIAIIVKDVGLLVVMATIMAGLAYTIIDLPIVIIGEKMGVMLRLIGVIFVGLLSFVPYLVMYNLILRLQYYRILLFFGCIFLIGNIFVLVDIFLQFSPLFGFLGLVIFPITFSVAVLFFWMIDSFMYNCLTRYKVCRKISTELKKKISIPLSKC